MTGSSGWPGIAPMPRCGWRFAGRICGGTSTNSVLIARVHPKILRNEGLPDSLRFETAVWQDRYRSILDLEAHLHRNGTRIVKFYLHLSKDEQRKRFLDRIDEPEKN